MFILHDYKHLKDTRTRRRGGLSSCINGRLDRSDDGGWHCVGQGWIVHFDCFNFINFLNSMEQLIAYSNLVQRRLVHAFRRRCPMDLRWLEARCYSGSGTSSVTLNVRFLQFVAKGRGRSYRQTGSASGSTLWRIPLRPR